MSHIKLRLCVLSLFAVGRVAAASPNVSPAIVVESYDGQRPADAAPLLKPVYAALVKRGFVAQDKLVALLEGTLSRAGGVLSASQSAEAQRDVEQGYEHFINGDYQKAIASEEKAIALYGAASATLAKEPGLRDLQFKALVVAARSSEVLGKGEDAFRYMAEAIRTVPDRPINASEFDPSVKALHKKTKDELTKQGSGTLEVKVDDPTAVVFVDERFVGTGAVRLDGLLPGRYRVYVAKGEQAGRVREVELPAKGHASIDVPWEIDGVLRTRDDYVGLETPRGAGTDGEIDEAIKIGRAVGARRVVVVGVRTVEDRRSIVAYSVSTESHDKVYGAVQVEPVSPPPATLEKLSALMAGDKIDAEGIITKEPAPTRTRRVIGSRPSVMHKLKWIVGAGALATLGTGGALIAIDSKPAADGARTVDYKDTRTLGIGVAAGGALLTAIAVYMFTADHPVDIEAEDAPGHVAISPTLAPDGIGFAIAGRF